jgi:hypothetical protein
VERGHDLAVLATSFIPRDTHRLSQASPLMGIARPDLAKSEIA